jgi:uncharacterized protein YrrD
MKDMQGYAIRATDGMIGHVKDLYFDDVAWVIRYLVVDAGTWLSSRKVLISPIAVGHPNWTEKVLPVSITTEQVKNSPDIDTEKPVTRQHEIRYLGHYGYPFYWGGAGLWGGGIYPNMMVPDYPGFESTPHGPQSKVGQAHAQAEAARHQDDDLHLRSCHAVIDYHIQATSGDIGHLQDMLFDEATWAIRYLIVDTSNWWLGHQVLIAPQWIRNVSWHDATISVNLTQQSVKGAPAYDSTAALNREQETNIYEHYRLPGYWADEARREAAR